MKSGFVRTLFLIGGFISLGLGVIGIVLPILPTTPFLLLASFCFANGSKRFHDWFIQTSLYRNHIDDFVKTNSMTLRKKLTILIPVSCLLIWAFVISGNIYSRVTIAFLFIAKYYYFFFKIKTA